MNVLHICSSDFGGAAIAAIRLHNSLLQKGINSKMLVLIKRSKIPSIHSYRKNNVIKEFYSRVVKKLPTRKFNRYAPLIKYKNDFEAFTFAATPYHDLTEHPLVKECDIVNLHWVSGFVDYRSFFEKINKPLVWTLHDMNPFLGGFHYKGDENRNRSNDVVNKLNDEQYRLKLKAVSQLPTDAMFIVAPSFWLYQEASNSEILGRFEKRVIPYGIDSKIFDIKRRSEAKKKIGVDTSKVTVLSVAVNLQVFRKGFDFTLDLLKDETILSKAEFLAVGNGQLTGKMNSIKFLGKIKTEQDLSDIYNAADILLLPSREDNLPNVMLESLACGTPVVAFEVGGMKDVIKNGENGFLANQVNLIDLKSALKNCIDQIYSLSRENIAFNTHCNYSYDRQATVYLDVYKSIKEKQAFV